jgi:hypothetical protein
VVHHGPYRPLRTRCRSVPLIIPNLVHHVIELGHRAPVCIEQFHALTATPDARYGNRTENPDRSSSVASPLQRPAQPCHRPGARNRDNNRRAMGNRRAIGLDGKRGSCAAGVTVPALPGRLQLAMVSRLPAPRLTLIHAKRHVSALDADSTPCTMSRRGFAVLVEYFHLRKGRRSTGATSCRRAQYR